MLAQGLRGKLLTKTTTCCPLSMLPTPELTGATRFSTLSTSHSCLELAQKALQMSAEAHRRACSVDRTMARESSSKELTTILTRLDWPNSFITGNNYELCQQSSETRQLFHLAWLSRTLYFCTFLILQR